MMPLGGAETGARTIQGVSSTPGWNVVSEFLYVESEHVATSGTLERKFRAVAIATSASLQVRARLVRADTLSVVTDSTLTFTAPVLNETEHESVDLTANLVDGVIYQIQAEVTGGATSSDLGTITASVNAIYSY
jgi:hypothetical protein